jgi:hypothetical protein
MVAIMDYVTGPTSSRSLAPSQVPVILISVKIKMKSCKLARNNKVV